MNCTRLLKDQIKWEPKFIPQFRDTEQNTENTNTEKKSFHRMVRIKVRWD